MITLSDLLFIISKIITVRTDLVLVDLDSKTLDTFYIFITKTKIHITTKSSQFIFTTSPSAIVSPTNPNL